MKIYLGADHWGIKLKTKLNKKLTDWGYEVKDLGFFDEKKSYDFPIIAQKVAQQVTGTKDSLGILICKSGQGMCIGANKIRGARAATAWRPSLAKVGREADYINILCLSAGYIRPSVNIKIVKTFLKSKPIKKSRYIRRTSQLKLIENGKNIQA